MCRLNKHNCVPPLGFKRESNHGHFAAPHSGLGKAEAAFGGGGAAVAIATLPQHSHDEQHHAEVMAKPEADAEHARLGEIS